VLDCLCSTLRFLCYWTNTTGMTHLKIFFRVLKLCVSTSLTSVLLFKVTRGPHRHKMAISWASIFILRKKSRGSKEWHFVKSNWFTVLMLLLDSLLYLIHPCVSVTNIIPTCTLLRTRFGRDCGPVVRQTVKWNEWILLTSLRLR